MSLTVSIDKIFPVALLSDSCVLPANMAGCDYSWKPEKKKKRAHQFQNHTSREIKDYGKFSVSHEI